ncbi:MAG: biotin--[Prevotella sp.]|nr:biotin--[acetyl-CoA-carboxylase] ligase [Prevotella sp.]
MKETELIHLAETDSTNRWLREHPAEGNVAVWTDYQSAGRGCGTNTWESERGRNLLFSLLIHPAAVKASEQFSISMAISLAIVDALSTFVAEGLSIKWPNDIYWRDRKLCGILIECSLSGQHIRDCIIGVGLNVNQECFLSDAPNPVSLRQILAHELDREALLKRILDAFTPDEVDAARYRSLLYRREGLHPYRDADGPFEARLVTVEPDGHLILIDVNGRQRRYAFKEVSFEIPKSRDSEAASRNSEIPV